MQWYPNSGTGAFGLAHGIPTLYPQNESVRSARAADDEVVARGRRERFENDGKGTFSAIHLIADAVHDSEGVWAADLDGHGDQDALLTSETDRKVVWLENLDGLGTFGAVQVLKATVHEPEPVLAEDMDGDGDLDVVYGTSESATIAWLENDGAGVFGQEHSILPSEFGFVPGLAAADLDGDGDSDVVAARAYPEGPSWHENDGSGGFVQKQLISATESSQVTAADMDSDGDLDVLFHHSSHVSWCANDGSGVFSADAALEHQPNGFSASNAADVDGDGDVDAVAVHHTSGGGNYPRWYENQDGKGSFSAAIVLAPGGPGDGGIADALLADADGDGDQDLFRPCSLTGPRARPPAPRARARRQARKRCRAGSPRRAPRLGSLRRRLRAASARARALPCSGRSR